MTNRTFVTVVVVGASFFLIAGWRLSVALSAPPPMVAGIVVDRSQSVATTTQCAAAVGLAEVVLSDPAFTKKGELLLFATGDRSTRMEPLQLGTFTAPHSRRALSGKQEVEEQREHILRTVGEACRNAGRASASPIGLAIQRALTELHQRGCGPRRQCVLYVATDGMETSEGVLTRALQGKPRKGERPLRLLDNAGVPVRMCGIAETSGPEGDQPGRRTMRSAERLQRVWTAFFMEPTVVLQPFCPKLTLKPKPATSAGTALMGRLGWL